MFGREVGERRGLSDQCDHSEKVGEIPMETKRGA